MIKIVILRICGDFIYLEHGVFPQNWKKDNVAPIHNKVNLQQYQVNCTRNQEHVGMFLDDKLSLRNKFNKPIGLLRKLQVILPRRLLAAISNFFISAYLGYEDIIFDQVYNKSFHVHNNAFLIITDAIRGTSRGNFYQELALKSPQLKILVIFCYIYLKSRLISYLSLN